MAFWNRTPSIQKAGTVNYAKIVDAMTKYFSGQSASIPQNDNAYINEAYFLNDHVYSVIRLLTRAASTIPIYLYKVVDKKSYRRYKNLQSSENPDLVKLHHYKTKALEQIEKHEIIDTLEQPNPLQAQPEFIENVLGYKYLLGNSYMMGIGPDGGKNAGTFKEIYVLPSQDIEIKVGKGFEPIESYILNKGQTKVEIPPEQICHLKTWSPDYSSAGSNLYGVSPIRAGRNKIKAGNDGASTMIKMLENMGMFGMFALKNSNDVDFGEDQARNLERMFSKKQRAKGSTMFTSGEFEWQSAGMSPVDLAILESNMASLRDICNLFSISSQLLNDPANKTYNNMKEARKAMWTNGVLPDFNSLIGELNRWLVAPYNKKSTDTLVLDYDMKAIPELQEDMEKLVGYVEKMYWATIDEQRAMSGMDGSTGSIGDKIAMPTGRILTDTDGNTPVADLTTDELEKLLKGHLEAGRY